MGTMPSSESETMGTVIPESGGTVMVWDNDTQTFVPAAAHVGRSVSLAFAGNGDVVDHAAVALLGSAVLDHGGLHGMLLDHAGVHGLV